MARPVSPEARSWTATNFTLVGIFLPIPASTYFTKFFFYLSSAQLPAMEDSKSGLCVAWMKME